MELKDTGAFSLKKLVSKVRQLNYKDDRINPKKEPAEGRALGVSDSVKFCLRALKDSADAFPPLKSLVGAIAFFLDNHETWEANKETLERLISRISQLVINQQSADNLSEPAERQRREALERKFLQIVEGLENVKNGGRVLKYVTAKNESTNFLRILEDINSAIMDYQLSLQQESFAQILSLVKEADMNVLDKLPRAKGASYQSREPNAGCEPGTRLDVLNKLESWVNNEDRGAQRVYWLNGHAGSGKSTIAHSFCQRLYSSGQLGASFFCSRDFLERSDIKIIFPTLAFQLAYRYPSFRTHLVDALIKRPDLGCEAMITQLTELLVRPLQASGISTTISIDALDECKDRETASTILSLLAQVIDQIPYVKFFVTGRPEAPIIEGFRVAPLRLHTDIMLLHEVEQSDIDHDIALYINARLHDLANHRRDLEDSKDWPPEDKINILVAKSDKYFIFASTCIKLISSPPPSDPQEVLNELTESLSTSLEGRAGVDSLYAYILNKAFCTSSIKIRTELRLILAATILSYNPLPMKVMSNILNIPRLATRLNGLQSLLLVPLTDLHPVRIHHKSFSDYLTDHRRCIHESFYIDRTIYHTEIAIACLDYLKNHLRKNICSLPRYTMNSVMSITTRRECIGEALEYASRFWVRHVCEAAGTGEHLGRLLPVVHEFLQERQVLWIEVLSLLDDIHHSVFSLRELEAWLSKSQINTDTSKHALRWLEDGLLLVLRFFDCLQESAWHLYHSALPLAPKHSLLRITHSHDLTSEGTVLRGSDQWDTRRAFRVNASEELHSLTFSDNGTMIATAGDDVIEVFNVLTGKRLYTLKLDSFTGTLNAAAKFVGKDSKILAGRGSSTELWDLRTGCLIDSYSIPGYPISSRQIVDMSLDQSFVASGDSDGYVHVWVIASPSIPNHKLKVGGTVSFISFSSSGTSLFVCSYGIIRCWNFREDRLNQFECTHKFRDFDISADRSLLAASTFTDPESHIALFDAETGQLIWKHHSDERLRCVSILPNEHALYLLSPSLFYMVDYNSSSVHTVSEHSLPKFDLRSSVTSSDLRYIAHLPPNRGSAFASIHHLQIPQSKGRSFHHPDMKTPQHVQDIYATLDGTMGVASCEPSEQIRVCSIRKDITLMSPELLVFLRSPCFTPNRKFIAITSLSFERKSTIIQLWDLDQASLAWTISTRQHSDWDTAQFIDDNTYLLTCTASNELSRFGFSSTRLDAARQKSVSGVVGSLWHLDLPWSASGHRSCLIKTKVSESDGRRFCHLEATAYSSPDPCPKLHLNTLESQGWLTDTHGKKFFWVPHDTRAQRGLGWGTREIFLTAGSSGVFTAIDFSNLHDIELHDSASLLVEHQEKLVQYVRKLQEIS